MKKHSTMFRRCLVSFAAPAALYLIIWGGAAQADLGLRCGTSLITEGDYIDRVLKECGEPSFADSWVEERIYRYPNPYPRYGGDEYDRYGPADGIIVQVRVEEWTYNHGPHRFIDRVIFENGRVRKIISGDYGY